MFARYKDHLDIEGIRKLVESDSPRLSEKRSSLVERLSARFNAYSIFLFSSRQAALSLLLRALDVGVGNEVVIPALTDPAVADIVLGLKAIPHMVDVEPSRLAMKPTSLRRVLANGRSRLVIDMPLAGAIYRDEGVAAMAVEYGVPFVADLSQSWPTHASGEPAAPNAEAVVFSLASGYPIVTGRGGVLAVRNEGLAERIEALITDIPRDSRYDDGTALKGLLVQNRLLSSDVYDGSDAPADLGYLYASEMGDSLELGALTDGDYLKVAAHEALAERGGLTAPPNRNLIRRFYRWLYPSTAVPEMSTGLMGDLNAAVAELHSGSVEEDRDRRVRLARFYRSELVRLDQVDTVDTFGGGDD
ncbi:MAG: hypothetical protein GY771_10535, partial [bacterium]|nr:hypothetical protein [bacterium]